MTDEQLKGVALFTAFLTTVVAFGCGAVGVLILFLVLPLVNGE